MNLKKSVRNPGFFEKKLKLRLFKICSNRSETAQTGNQSNKIQIFNLLISRKKRKMSSIFANRAFYSEYKVVNAIFKRSPCYIYYGRLINCRSKKHILQNYIFCKRCFGQKKTQMVRIAMKQIYYVYSNYSSLFTV